MLCSTPFLWLRRHRITLQQMKSSLHAALAVAKLSPRKQGKARGYAAHVKVVYRPAGRAREERWDSYQKPCRN